MQPTPSRCATPRQVLAGFDSFATMFLLGVTISLLGPSLPELAARTNIALPQAGIFFTLFSGGSVLASLLLARYLDRPIRHALVVIGAFVMGVGLLMTAVAGTFAMVALSIALTGVAMSTAGTTPNAIVADLYGEHSAKALNLLHFVAGIGSFCGPLLIGVAVQAGGNYTLAYRITGLATIIVAALWAVSRPPVPLGSVNHRTRLERGDLQQLVFLLLLAALYTGTEQTIGGWLFTFVRETSAVSIAAASAVTSLFWLAILGGRLIASLMVSRLGIRALLLCGTLLGIAGVAVAVAGSGMLVTAWIGVSLMGLGFGPVFPTTLAMGARRFPDNAGLTSALVVAFGSIGAMLLPLTAGSLIPLVGIRGTIASTFFPLGLMLLCIVAIGRIWR